MAVESLWTEELLQKLVVEGSTDVSEEEGQQFRGKLSVILIFTALILTN